MRRVKFNTFGHDTLDEISSHMHHRGIDLLYLTPNYERSRPDSEYEEDWEFCISIEEDEKLFLQLKYGDVIRNWREVIPPEDIWNDV